MTDNRHGRDADPCAAELGWRRGTAADGEEVIAFEEDRTVTVGEGKKKEKTPAKGIDIISDIKKA